MNYMQIVVVAEVYDPVHNQQYTSNTFYYTYSIADETVPTVLPKTYSQAMWYLDGRRKFNYAMSMVSLSL